MRDGLQAFNNRKIYSGFCYRLSGWDITKTTIKMTDTRIIKIDKLAIMYNKKG